MSAVKTAMKIAAKLTVKITGTIAVVGEKSFVVCFSPKKTKNSPFLFLFPLSILFSLLFLLMLFLVKGEYQKIPGIYHLIHHIHQSMYDKSNDG